MLNMNCDGGICEADIFTFLELHNDSQFFKKALIYDIQDISDAFARRNKQLVNNDAVMDYTNPDAPTIKSLTEFLKKTKKRNQYLVDIHEQEVYTNTLLPAPVLTDEQKQSQVDPNSDWY